MKGFFLIFCLLIKTKSYAQNLSAKFNIDTNKIGVIRFSAGGNLSARAATNFKLKALDSTDKIDKIPSRPDSALLIYPGSMSTAEDRHLITEIPVDVDTPPVFIFVATDDPYNILFSMGAELRKNKIPFEHHISPKGGYGYGLRKGNPAAEAWFSFNTKLVKIYIKP